MIFDPKKGGSFFDPPPPSLKTSKKWVSSGGSLGGSGPKTHWGMRLLGKIMILQGVKLTIQPLGVGYANRPKKAKMGGYVVFSPYIRLPGFYLTTSATSIFELPRVKDCISRLCTNPLGAPPPPRT